MTAYIGTPLAITELQTKTINQMFSEHIGTLPVEAAILLFGAYKSLGEKAAAGKIEVVRHIDGMVEAFLMKEHQFDHRPLFDALRLDGVPQSKAPDLDAVSDFREEARTTMAAFREEIAAAAGTPPRRNTASRISELMRIIEDNRDIADGLDDFPDESMAANARMTEAEKEMFNLPVRTAEDAQAVVRLFRREFLADRVGETLGWGEVGILNLLDNLSDYVRQQER
ncbi:hypothetical protein K9U40_09335 [Xanthobacter autotrophicus]|uniref:hypothetical protein n=1 Tax=Xanthobacter TaxID=279 RepID=UPI0024ABC702|nr:hypothetical protein [Xanthobacter autotrophicus]MDI4664526.1 hypothetical protein [Xanthobacter autotrophicus]